MVWGEKSWFSGEELLQGIEKRREEPFSTANWQSIRKVHILLRVDFFSWSAILGKILTTNNLRKQGIIILD